MRGRRLKWPICSKKPPPGDPGGGRYRRSAAEGGGYDAADAGGAAQFRVPMTSTASMLMYLPAASLESRQIFTVCLPDGSVPVFHTFCW